MTRIIKLTESDLTRIVRRVIIESKSSEKEEDKEVKSTTAIPDCCKPNSNGGCNCWNECGGESYYNGTNGRPKISIQSSDSYFSITYVGSASGHIIKHGKCGGGDSIHQACNVLTYEINKYLKGKQLKPNINKIDFVKSGNKFTIGVPLEKSEKGYYLERRGRMNVGEQGKDEVIAAYKNKEGYEGPVRYSSGGIIEFFVTYYQ